MNTLPEKMRNIEVKNPMDQFLNVNTYNLIADKINELIDYISLTETVDKSTEVGASSEVVATQKKDQTKV